MMSLLKWQAKILNKLFKTNVFQRIVLDHTDLEQLDYRVLYRILDQEKIAINKDQINQNNKISIEEVVQSANMVCQPTLQSTLMRDQILKLNYLLENINQIRTFKPQKISESSIQQSQISQDTQYKEEESKKLIETQQHKPQYSIQHVIIYSSLSKCRIWPKMLKSSSTLVPSLIGFYNKFTKDFSYDLSYKFDPVILTHKYEKVMNRIQEKKKSFPELFTAIEKNDWNLICTLIENFNENQKQANFINQCKKENYYVCHYAVMYSDLEIIKKLYDEYKLNFEKQDHQKQTALFYAVKRNSFQITKFLIEEVKVNINHKEYQNRTPIYLAAFEGNLKIVDYLYSKGANPQMESKLSRTPLSKACYLGNVSVAQYLIKIGVNLTTIDSKGRTALHNAAWGIEGGRDGKKRGNIKLEDSPQCAQLLLQAGHPVDLQDFDGFTPLMSAAASLAVKSMRVLIKYGANLNHKTKKNETVAFVAAKYGHLDTLRILIEEFNCDYEEPSCYGVSPLDASLTTESTDVSIYLLNLYFSNKKLFSFQSLIKCLCYYKRETNLSYLKEWALQDQQKKDYLYSSLKYQLQNKENFLTDLFENQKDLLPCFLEFFEFQINKLDLQIIEFILSLSISAYKKGLLPSLPQFLCQNQKLFKQKQIKIKDLEIQIHSKEEDIIKLLSIDTNLTQNHKSVHRCMLFLVKRRMTKVLLWILTLHENKSNVERTTGFYRLTNDQILEIVRHESEEQSSIVNYCFIHGIHDAVKILQLDQKQLKIHIPKYEYSFNVQENPHSPGILFPVRQFCFDLSYLLKNHLSQEEADFYISSMSLYDKTISEVTEKIKMVENLIDLEQMNNHFKSCRLIGIDIEHYNNSSEQFVCLVQVSGLGKTFLIDALKIQKEHIKSFLRQILVDEDKIKVFHSYDQDLKWIGEDFHVDSFRSVVDTSKMYGILNPKNKSPSLKLLAQLFLSQKISKDFQRSDWRIRPLFKEMVIYAGTDALLLPFLYLKQLMQANVEIGNEKDKQFWESIKKHFGSKRHIKCKGRKNYLKLLEP